MGEGEASVRCRQVGSGSETSTGGNGHHTYLLAHREDWPVSKTHNDSTYLMDITQTYLPCNKNSVQRSSQIYRLVHREDK